MEQKKYQFKKTAPPHKKMLICPKCFEMLSHSDIENFHSCPYCTYKFEKNSELEDFILQPVIENWVNHVEFREENAIFTRLP
jgi:uncharacterized CHY-type Zn-finger protein